MGRKQNFYQEKKFHCTRFWATKSWGIFKYPFSTSTPCLLNFCTGFQYISNSPPSALSIFPFKLPSIRHLISESCFFFINTLFFLFFFQILTDRFAPSGQVPSQKCTGLNYCGGTFRGIEKHLDYITGLGANAIWISPTVVNTPNGYHGYWAQNIFEINPHFGTKEDLKSLVTACHDRDVWVMVDVVANHMGYPPSTDPVPDVPVNLVPRDFSLAGDEVDVPVTFNKFVPFNDSKYFHPRHPYINWPEECKDQWKIELYWLANLPDLNQSHPFVHQTLLKWIQDLTTEFMFDGVRLDTAIQVPKPFWAEFRKAGGVFMMGEASNGPPPCGSMEYVGQYQEYIDSVLAFPMYWTLRWIFQEKSKDFTSLSRAVSTSYEIYKDRLVIWLLSIFM